MNKSLVLALLFVLGSGCSTLANAQVPVSAPAGVATISPYNGQVNLTWQGVSGATSYAISRDIYYTPTFTDTPGGPATPTPLPTSTPIAVIQASSLVASTTTPVFTDFQVTDGQVYQYTIWGVNASGNGPSTQVTALPFTMPAAIDPTVQNLHRNALDISWSLPLSTFPIASYNIYRQTSATIGAGNTMPVSTFLTAVPTFVATVTSLSYSDQQAATIVGASAVFYTVLGVDSNGVTGCYPPNTSAGALANSNLPPVAPVLSGYAPFVQTATTTPTTTPINGFQLVWNAPLPAETVTVFQVLANNTAVIATITVAPTISPTYTYLDPGLFADGGPTSVYSIISTNANGSVTSNQVQESVVLPSMNIGAQVTPAGGIQVTPNPTTNSVTITWGSGNSGTYGLQGYYVYRGTSGAPSQPYPNVTWTISPTPSPTAFAFVNETPSATQTAIAIESTNNANYTYWVQPFYQLFGSSPTTLVGNTVSATLNLAPTPVTNVAANQVQNTNNKVTVSWSGASPGFYNSITNYAIYRSYVGGTPTIVATVSAARSMKNDYVDNLTGTAASYTYFVGAIDAFGNISDLSVLSNTITLNSITGFVPQSPKTLPSFQTSTNLIMNWVLNPAADNVTSYTVFGPDYPNLIITPTPIFMTTATATPFSVSVPPLWASTPYYLVANNAVGSSQAATLSVISAPTYQVTAVVQTPTQGVSLSWNVTPLPDATPNVDSWVIYRSSATPTPGGDTRLRPITVISSTNTGYLDTSAVPGVLYSYFVTGRSDLGGTVGGTPVAESPISVTGNAPGTIRSWPNAPTGLVANTGSIATTLIWNINATPDAVQNYTVLHNGTPTCTVVPMTTESVVFGETPGIVSTYQVVANNPSGPSNSSVTLAVFPIPSITPVVSLNTPTGYVPVATITPGVWISGITWPSGGAQECTVYRSTDPTFSILPAPLGVLNSSTVVLQDSAPVSGYVNYYKFVADNGAGVTASFTLSGIVGINVWPNSPSSFYAAAGSSAVTLNWTAPVTGNSPVTAYEVYRGLVPIAIATYTPQPTVIPFHTGPFIDNQVAVGTPYFYYMDSMSGGLRSAPTTESAVMPGPSLALSGSAGVSQAILNWSPVTQVTTPGYSSYVIKRLSLATPIAAVATQVYSVSTVTNTTYTDTTTGYSTGYVYQVAPVAIATTNENVYGPYSNSVTVTVPPQGPTSVSAVSGDQIAQLRWNYQGAVASTAYTYTIQRKMGTAPVSAFQNIATGLTGLSYNDTGLLDKTLYNYQILAIDPNTSLIGYSPIANALPAVPPIVNCAALTLVQSQSGNTISWCAANMNVNSGCAATTPDFNSTTMYPLGGYHVYRSSDGGGSYQLLNPQGTTATSYTDDIGIINGSTYTYLVRAYDAPPNVNTNDPNIVHETTYNTVTATGLTASVALDRNSLRPFGSNGAGGTPNQQVVDIRFVVTNPGMVTIKVYSISGVFIKQLVSQYFGVGVYGIGGNYNLQWDGRNASGDLVASGVYMITTEMNGLQDIEKIAVIK